MMREERKQKPDQQLDEAGSKEKRDDAKDKRDRKFKKPDMQIYRPGMGRISSKAVKKVSSKPRTLSPEEKKPKSKKKHDEQPADDEKPSKKDHPKKSSVPSTPQEESKPEFPPVPSQVEPASAPVSKSKSYRANRAAKQKKSDADVKKDESSKEKADTEPATSAAADLSKEGSSDVKQTQALDDDKIPPLTASKHVIILDNDQRP